jgi:hypothetical protein
VAHLQNDSINPYFINGKAGSGKSTLMRFVQDHQTTRDLLGEWAGSKRLAVSHFYFWNLGTILQKTHTGLLRSLLYDILKQYPELIPAVFPKLYASKLQLDENHPPEHVELKEAFSILVDKSEFMRIAIFIDGIDEFEGDHRDMGLFLRSLTSTNLKLVISSRPLNACLDAFEGCPSLKLQNLTRPDMERYVDKELSSHSLMIQSPDQGPMLTTELLDKADGVFLWVVITVRFLIQGLENGDDLDELQLTLKSLPVDLRSLYRRMFEKMDPRYRMQGSMLFQLMRKWDQFLPDRAFLAVAMFYATQNPSTAFNMPISNAAFEDRCRIVECMERRVRSRTCGLLEVRNLYPNGPRHDHSLDASIVTYMHRTVGEFLALDEVWEEVCSVTECTDFEPTLCLASACLAVAKTTADDRIVQTQKDYLGIAAMFCRETTSLTPQMAHRYVTELYKMRSAMGVFFVKPHSIHALAEEVGILQYYLSTPYLDYVAQLDKSHQELYAMTDRALRNWTRNRYGPRHWNLTCTERARLLSHILTHVVGPDNITFGRDLWLTVLIVCDILHQSERGPDCIALLLVTFLRTSRDPAALWQQACENQRFTSFDPKTFLQMCRTKSDVGVDEEVNLFEELKRLVTPEDSLKSIEDTNRGSGKKRGKSKKRKNKDHQPANKRRR